MPLHQFHPLEPTRPDASLILPLVIGPEQPTRISSVVDFGCNDGQWLAECIRLGVADVFGVDGGGMLPNLRIPASQFMEWDLSRPLDLGRRFDLALCIEVAEHLPGKSADTLVGTIVRHSDLVLFSAATPKQGGYGHLNEQPHQYWFDKFASAGYSYDTTIRHRLSEGVAWWLRKNLCLLKRTI